jgi:hypothetical protein
VGKPSTAWVNYRLTNGLCCRNVFKETFSIQVDVTPDIRGIVMQSAFLFKSSDWLAGFQALSDGL